MPHFSYLLRCADGTLYAGYTDHLSRRVHAHNHLASAARYTKSRRPVVLVWSKSFRDKSLAMRQEAQIKKMSRAQKITLIESGKIPQKFAVVARKSTKKTCRETLKRKSK